MTGMADTPGRFDPSKHPTGAGHRFVRKPATAPHGALDDTPDTADADGTPSRVPLRVAVLDRPDPSGGFDVEVDAPTGRHWLRGGLPHRTDGPAYEGDDGTTMWFRDGLLDRAGGPAVVHGDGQEEHWRAGVPVRLP